MKLNIKRHDMPEPFPVEVVEIQTINGRQFFAYETEAGEYAITDLRTGALLCSGLNLEMTWEMADYYAALCNFQKWDSLHQQINEIPCT